MSTPSRYEIEVRGRPTHRVLRPVVDDFRIDRAANVLWVRNAPSPAATSSLAIAEDLVGRL